VRKLLAAALTAIALASCSGNAPGPASGRLSVAAAENVWGSIAAQLGGDHVAVTNIINNPNADPHDYEVTAADARRIASARLVIENGIGYDAWMQRLLDANPVKGREVLNVGTLVGVAEGGNPHQWYSPASVRKVIDAITDTYVRLEPGSRSYFEDQRTQFVNVTLKPYNDLLTSIRATYAGTPVGASESIFAPMAQALGLRLITPAGFLKAVSEGTDPTAADKSTIDAQIRARAIKVYVYNPQNATPDVQRQVNAARANSIVVTTMTETLVPAGASFEDWQVAQLHSLANALASATGR